MNLKTIILTERVANKERRRLEKILWCWREIDGNTMKSQFSTEIEIQKCVQMSACIHRFISQLCPLRGP